jgi:Fe-S-cluster containining protein
MNQKQKGRDNSWPCQNCGDCCVNTPIDKDLVDRMREKFQRTVIKEHISREIKGVTYLTIVTTDNKCVFLDNDNKCVIYQNRPGICRDFGRRPGDLECIHVTPSGRIRTPAESERVKKKVKKLYQEKKNLHGNKDKFLFGVSYSYDD